MFELSYAFGLCRSSSFEYELVVHEILTKVFKTQLFLFEPLTMNLIEVLIHEIQKKGLMENRFLSTQNDFEKNDKISLTSKLCRYSI